MRFKIKLNLDKIPLKKLATETAKHLNKTLGKNHKWHDLTTVKPYTCSFIMGGKQVGDNIIYKNYAYFYLNTEDEEVINAIVSNPSIEFDIENVKVFSDYNLFSVKKVIYNKSSKRHHITEENKKDFIAYVKAKYFVDIEILKLENKYVSYKKNSTLPVTNILIKASGGNNVENLLNSGIGGSCSIGFGHVEPINTLS